MMRRRIFLWMGLCVLFASVGFPGEGFSRESYRVRQGDTLYGISRKVGVAPDALMSANRLKNSNLTPRQILLIPISKVNKSSKSTDPSYANEEVYRVKRGDTLARIAKKTGVPLAELRRLNHLRESALKIGQSIALKKRTEIPQEAVAPTENASLAAGPEEEEVDAEIVIDDDLVAGIDRREKEKAALFGTWQSPDESKLLVKVAMGFLGAPYRLGGSSVTGIDCSGFVKKIYQIFNIDLPRTAFEQSHIGLAVSRDELAEGDLLFFNTRRTVGHVGIYIGNNEFVHASSRKRGVRVDNLNTPYYEKRFARAVRLKGSGDGM